MKKLVLTILTLTLINVSFAQKIDFGAKAGLNYNFGGDLSEVSTEVGFSFIMFLRILRKNLIIGFSTFNF